MNVGDSLWVDWYLINGSRGTIGVLIDSIVNPGGKSIWTCGKLSQCYI